MQSEQSPSIEPIKLDEVSRLGIDKDNNLYWDGRKIQTTVEVRLERWSKWAAIFGAGGVVVNAVISLVRALVDFWHCLHP
jgi:hypothetical protein